MVLLRIMTVVFAAFGLFGCGGTTIQEPVQPVAAFATLDQAAQDLIVVYNGATFTPMDSLPVNETASYAGYFGATIYNNMGNRVTRIVGQAAANVAFGASQATVTGGVGNFMDETEGAMQGVLTFSNGSLDPDGDPQIDPTFVGQAQGLLRWPRKLNRQIDVVLEGDLRGSNHAALAGEVLGQHTASGGSGQVIGSFILER